MGPVLLAQPVVRQALHPALVRAHRAVRHSALAHRASHLAHQNLAHQNRRVRVHQQVRLPAQAQAQAQALYPALHRVQVQV